MLINALMNALINTLADESINALQWYEWKTTSIHIIKSSSFNTLSLYLLSQATPP